MKETQSLSRAAFKRRNLVAGSVWAVPAIAVAAATPAYAASGPAPEVTTMAACKNPGNSCAQHPKGYTIPAKICNTQGRTIYIYSVRYTNVQGSTLKFTYAAPPALPIVLPPNQCVSVKLNAASANSANGSFTLDMVLEWGAADSTSHSFLTVPISIDGTPPDCPCS